MISTDPREVHARGTPCRENSVRGAAPRDSKPGRPMLPVRLQPKARTSREIAPPSPPKPIPRGEYPAIAVKRAGTDESRDRVVEEKAGKIGFDENMNGRTRCVGRRLLEIEGKVQFEGKAGTGLGGSGWIPRRERGRGGAAVAYEEPCLEE